MRDNYYRLGGPFGNNLLCKSADKWIQFTEYDPEFHPDILFEDKFKTSNFLKQRNAFEGMD
jgi:hypothetical protein